MQKENEAKSEQKMTWNKVIRDWMSGRPYLINESPKCGCYAFMEDNKNGQENHYKIHR